jgi:hypothetical protein
VVDPYGPWVLELFEERLQHWRDTEHPPPDVYDIVKAWVPSRRDAPYRNASRMPDEDDFWLAFIPGAYLPDLDHGPVRVACSYWVSEVEHKLVCDGFGQLGAPG